MKTHGWVIRSQQPRLSLSIRRPGPWGPEVWGAGGSSVILVLLCLPPPLPPPSPSPLSPLFLSFSIFFSRSLLSLLIPLSLSPSLVLWLCYFQAPAPEAMVSHSRGNGSSCLKVEVIVREPGLCDSGRSHPDTPVCPELNGLSTRPSF